MSKVTVWLTEDEYWPWRHISDEPKESLRGYYTAVEVDEETRDRWAAGLAAAEALQDEISEVWDAQTKRPDS